MPVEAVQPSIFEFVQDVAKQMSIGQPVYVYGSIAAGLFLAFNRAFVMNGIIKWSAILSPVVQALLELIKQQKLDLSFVAFTAGSFVLVISSFLFSFSGLGLFAAFFSISDSSWFDRFSEFMSGGYRAIDGRFKSLVGENRALKNEVRNTHTAYRGICDYLRDMQQPLTEEKFKYDCEVLLNSALTLVFGIDTQLRAAVFLVETTAPQELRLATAMYPNRTGVTSHQNKSWKIDSSIAGRSFSTGATIRYPNDKKFRSSFSRGRSRSTSHAQSFVCIRIENKHQKWGVLSIDSPTNTFPDLSEGQWLFLRSIALYVGEIIEFSNGCGKWSKSDIH